ncbi:MAG: cyclic lactone autoinducer peptide [Saccharofermentans sp.]|nr:cyclic lactone autoinducer peptide [Saccharofermentans sp.]
MKKLEKIVLEQIEKASRKTANNTRAYPNTDTPWCPSIFHQPKRPRK